MTRPPRTRHSLLALAGALLALACGGDSASSTEPTDAELYGTYCGACHGKDGRGFMNLAPSFAGVRRYWDEAKLLEYIADPRAFAAGVDRLGQREMAAISAAVPHESRVKIVRHALSLMN